MGLILAYNLLTVAAEKSRDIVETQFRKVIFAPGADPSLCMGIAICLHFFFLAAFAWMFMEGYQIYVLLVKVGIREAIISSHVLLFQVGVREGYHIFVCTPCQQGGCQEGLSDLCPSS